MDPEGLPARERLFSSDTCRLCVCTTGKTGVAVTSSLGSPYLHVPSVEKLNGSPEINIMLYLWDRVLITNAGRGKVLFLRNSAQVSSDVARATLRQYRVLLARRCRSVLEANAVCPSHAQHHRK